jgi:cell division protein FtsB
MASEKMREVRAWVNLFLTFLTVLIIPAGLLVLKNQRLEILEQSRKEFVSIETYRLNLATIAAENSSLKAEISLLSSKIERQTVTLARIVDAVKLKDPP